MKRTYNKDIIIFLFIFLIMAGKVVRYTVMKTTLVDEGAGHEMIIIINNYKVSFGLTFGNSDTGDTVSATDNATYIFKLINFLNLDTYEEFEIYISVIWNIILLFLLLRVKNSLSMSQMIFLMSSIAVLNIFDFCLAKEPIQMLYFSAIYLILISKQSVKKKYIFSLLIILLSAITYRTYYIIIFMFAIIVSLAFEKYIAKLKKVKKRNILVILIGLGLIYFAFLNVAKYMAPTEYAELLRVRLRTSTAVSDLRAIFMSNNLLIFSMDYVIVIIRILFPIELIRLGPKYLLYVVYQLIITYMMMRSVMQYKNISQTRKIALYIMIAFVLGSATFEPDFGSWIRHEAVTFPILLIVCGIDKFEETTQSDNKLKIRSKKE